MKNKKENEKEFKYSKESILKSIKYSPRSDILNVLLKDDKEYSLSEVEEELKKFMKGEIK